MSLDVYLTMRGAKVPSGGSGIYVREGGRTVEISREEWDRRYPGREPTTLEHDDEDDKVFTANITHNLNTMAGEAGLYEALWRPVWLVDPEIGERIDAQAEAGNYHEAGGAFELEGGFRTILARELIDTLDSGLSLLKSDPERFKRFNPENGWGSYEGLVEFVEDYLDACRQYPDAEVSVWR